MDPVTLKLAKNYAVGPVDLTGQADGDYIRNDGGVWKPRKPYTFSRDVHNNAFTIVLPGTAYVEGGATGTGSSGTPAWSYLVLTTGTTANSTAYRQTSRYLGYIYTRADGFDFSKRAAFITSGRRGASSTISANATRWIYFGFLYNDAVADPATQGFGFRVDGYDLKGICHDGATLTVVDLSLSVRYLDAKYAAFSDGAGNIEWYVNDVLRGQSAAGPTTDLRDCVFRHAVTNGADTTSNAWGPLGQGQLILGV